LPGIDFVKKMQSPRSFKTHYPMSLLPENIENKCKVYSKFNQADIFARVNILFIFKKVIYAIRNPKDVVVSFYHHMKLSKHYIGDFEGFLRLFNEDRMWFGPWHKHVDECTSQENIFLVHYEDIIQVALDLIEE
jgi:hypothetical protein